MSLFIGFLEKRQWMKEFSRSSRRNRRCLMHTQTNLKAVNKAFSLDEESDQTYTVKTGWLPAAKTAKAVAHAIVLAVKGIVAGDKALVAAIAAGGWVAVLVILIITIIGLIVGSCFGIFYSGQPYWSWYGFSSRVEWCACFVSWCANQCGYIEAGVIPKFAGCRNAVNWFQERGQWQDRYYTPNPGDIIFCDSMENSLPLLFRVSISQFL